MLTCKLEATAKRLWPDNPSLREKWIAAARYLLERRKWVLYGGSVSWTALPHWGEEG